MEGVDQVEASSRLNSLTTQLQVSYAVTARMFKLSLLDYL
ncbi:MAG: flagellin [Flavobacteriaceae bacterium]